MSVADKITRLTTARNNIRTAFNNKGISAGSHGFEDFSADVPLVYDKGKSDFISIIDNNGARDDFSHLFAKCTSLVTAPSIDTHSGLYFNYMFASCTSLTSLPTYNTSNGTQFEGMFQNCSSLVIIPQGTLDLSDANVVKKLFINCSSLTTILPTLYLNASDLSGVFIGCSSLQNVTFANNSIQGNLSFSASSGLTNASLISIANGLKSNVTGKTLTLHSTAKAKLSTITGTVTSGVFTADASGIVTLQNFILNTKGWSIA